MSTNPVELIIQRLNTERYIDLDPVWLTLTPRTEQFVAGTRTRVDGIPRISQKFKIIWGTVGAGFVPLLAGGETRRFDFILVGLYNANVAVGDHWVVGSQDNEIGYIYPSNGYEVKCGGYSHGGSPSA